MTRLACHTSTTKRAIIVTWPIIKYKCKEMWNINVNATYYDYTNIICELVVNDRNNDFVVNMEECNAVIS